jgi:hypothetical protein
MSVKVYIKRGNKNYKERRLLDELQPIISKKLENDPDFKFVPARNFEELKQLHRDLTSEDVSFEETSDEPQSTQTEQQNENIDPETTSNNMAEENETEEQVSYEEVEDTNTEFIDPLNRAEPEIRDYVTADDPTAEHDFRVDPTATFDEPTSFNEAFEIPDAEIVEETTNEKKSQTQEQKPIEQKTEKSSSKQENINPDFDTMSSGKKKKQTKKFAKYIVEAVTMLAEKGFVWFATKDINEAKLTEYELNGEMDLDLLVTLENGQEATVKQFFAQQCAQAQELGKIGDEQKVDLAEALGEVLMEKGVGPTPTQELMLVSLTIFGGQAIALMTMKAQQNSLLNQLRAMKEEERPFNQSPPPPPPTPSAPETHEPIHETHEEHFEQAQEVEQHYPEPAAASSQIELESVPAEDMEIGQTMETKE